MSAPALTLYGFGPGFGLPDPSPFVTKAELLLKLSGLPYRMAVGSRGQAPKGKLPYLRDGDVLIGDSTFIRRHLEQRHGIDFERGLSAEQRGIAWAIEKLCDDHLYWLLVQLRWLDDDNFARGPAGFFKSVPAPIRPVIQAVIRRSVRRTLHGQGLGRHSADERAALAETGFAAIAAVLGDKPYLMGDQPCGADATVFAFVAGALCPLFEGSLRRAAQAQPALVAYRDRLMAQYFPAPGQASSTPS